MAKKKIQMKDAPRYHKVLDMQEDLSIYRDGHVKNNEKYFVNDLGIRSLYFDNEKDIGQALENVVYLELRRRGYDIYVGKFDDKEVDFVAVDGEKKLYVQVTYLLAEQSTIDREFSVLEEIDDNYPKIVISMDKINRSRNGIIHKNIVDFLL